MEDEPTDRSNQHLFLLLVLLTFYSLGPLIALVWASLSLGKGLDIENVTLARIMVELSERPEAYTGILQQMIMPVAAAVTAAGHRTLLSNRLSRWLFLIPLAGIFICLCSAVLFNSVPFSDVDPNGNPIEGVEDLSPGQLFLNSAGQLATYVMLLVGLQLATPSSTPDKGSPGLEEMPASDEDRGSVEWTDKAIDAGKQQTEEAAGSGAG